MSPQRKKKVRLLCVLLLKKEAYSLLDGYIKNTREVTKVAIKDKFDIDGYIYYPRTQFSQPRWIADVDELSKSPVNFEMNSSNKAVLITNICGEILALTFGYGRSLLKEETIERNFGLKVALGIIDPNKIRSINTATYEDMVVASQRQASEQTSQDEFGLNTVSDIMRGVTGVPCQGSYGKSITGKDMLKTSVEMEFSQLKEKLTLYVQAYKSDKYKENFDWIDNINEVRDKVKSEGLDGLLIEKLTEGDVQGISISPPETVEWENIEGIYLTGIGKNNRQPEQSIDVFVYIEQAQTMTLEKLKRDRLMIHMRDGSEYTAGSVYSCIVTEFDDDGEKYILCMGKWYQVHKNFYDRVTTFLNDVVPVSDVQLPSCVIGMYEEDYIKAVVNGNIDYCLLDQRRIKVEDGPKDIEACDIFTRDHKFIHIKIKTRSSLLSHLFAQARVAYECFKSDKNFRISVAEIVNKRFDSTVINPDNDPKGFEIVYAIVTGKKGKVSDIIPFFSAVTFMQTFRTLRMLDVKCSLCIIPYQEA